jgi:hypothetical protein
VSSAGRCAVSSVSLEHVPGSEVVGTEPGVLSLAWLSLTIGRFRLRWLEVCGNFQGVSDECRASPCRFFLLGLGAQGAAHLLENLRLRPFMMRSLNVPNG